MQINKNSVLLSIFLSIFSFFLIVAYANSMSLGSGPIHITPEISNPYVEYNSQWEMLVNMKLRGDKIRPVKRPPVDLVLVIDESGSMHERGKLSYAKKAAKDLIAKLNSNDNLAIIAYSNHSRVIYPLQRLKNKSRVKRLIDNIYPTNATNLSSGLIEGIKQLKYGSFYDYGDRVQYRNLKIILLSDGLANRGITDIYSLSKIASRASSEGIYITTMGLGIHFDEDLMTAIAEYGAGNYYFIESPNQIAYIFDEEFGLISSTIARDVYMEIDLEDGVELDDIYGYTYEKKDNRVILKLGNQYSGQERNIRFSLNVPTDKKGRNRLFKSSLKYRDVNDGSAGKVSREVDYYVTDNPKKVVKNENKRVKADFTSVRAAKELETATKDYERGYGSKAIEKIKSAVDDLKALNSSSYRSNSTVQQQEVLEEALGDIQASPSSPHSAPGKMIIKKYKEESRLQQK